MHDVDRATMAAAMAAHARRVLGGAAPTAAFERLAAGGGTPAIRAHGDYHLGQVLRADGRWYVLDFEGEPARPMAERLVPASPLRDVAGMLRSFAYAAVVGEHPTGWEADCRGAFLDAYLATPGIAAILPADARPVLDAYELDKAIYEVAYERAHRPDWVAIPGAAVERLGRASAVRLLNAVDAGGQATPGHVSHMRNGRYSTSRPATAAASGARCWWLKSWCWRAVCTSRSARWSRLPS